MRSPFRRLAAGVAALTAAGALAAAEASAAPPFPITESFTGSTLEPGWVLGGTAALTAPSPDAAGQGWLRLTPALTSRFGYVFNDTAFPSTNGVLAEFDYAVHGGTGADGLVFFLYDGATSAAQFAPGPAGGSLGYSHCPQNGGAGLNNAYVGVGFDTWGNFALGSFCNQTGLPGSALYKNRVTVRAGETAPQPYGILASEPTSQPLSAARSEARHVTVAINDGLLQTYIRYPDGQIQTVAKDVALPAGTPATLKLGFVAGTGGSTNNHEIRNTKVVEPVDLVTTVTDGRATASERSTEHVWTATVTNDSPNATTDATVKATSDAILEDISWTCTSATGSCATASGSGLPDTSVDLPSDGVATFTITASTTSTTDVAQMALEAQPTGDTGELAPLDNVATDTTLLPPVNDELPTHSWNGANAARTDEGTWRGGELTLTRSWQTCEADGGDCTDSGATGASWFPPASIAGRTFRLAVTATNDAGQATAYGLPQVLPDTTITEPLSGTVKANATSVDFTHTGSTAQCRLDGGAWENCTSPWSDTLDRGEHTFEVRGRDGVLVDASPAATSWTIDDRTSVALSAPGAGPTADATPAIAFASDEPGDYVLSIDGDPVDAGVLDAEHAGSLTLREALEDGPHTIRVDVTDGVGNTAYAEREIEVDATAPAAPAPTGPAPAPHSPNSEQTFTWTSEPGSTSRCRLDGGPWTTCTSPHTLTGLPDGEHTFEVEDVDGVGNVGERTTTTWTVDTKAPELPEVPAPAAPVAPGPQTVTWPVEDGATSRCRVDGGAWKACTSPMVLDGLGEGEHLLEVEVTDRAGNRSEPLTIRWRVATPEAPGAAAPAPATQAVAPARQACTSRRAFPIRWTLPRGSKARAFRVLVDGRPVKRLRGDRRSTMVDLRGRTASVVRVTVEARGKDGRGLKTVRVYRTCRPGTARTLPTIALGRLR